MKTLKCPSAAPSAPVAVSTGPSTNMTRNISRYPLRMSQARTSDSKKEIKRHRYLPGDVPRYPGAWGFVSQSSANVHRSSDPG